MVSRLCSERQEGMLTAGQAEPLVPSVSPTPSTSYGLEREAGNGNGSVEASLRVAASGLISAAASTLHRMAESPLSPDNDPSPSSSSLSPLDGLTSIAESQPPTAVRQRKLAAIRAPSVGESSLPSPILKRLSVEPSTPSTRATTPVRARKRKLRPATTSVAPSLDSADRRRSGRIAKAAEAASNGAEISNMSLFGFSPYLEALILGASRERRTRSGIRSIRAQPLKTEGGRKRHKGKEKEHEGPDPESKQELYVQLCILSYQLRAELDLVPFKTLEQLRAEFSTPTSQGCYFDGSYAYGEASSLEVGLKHYDRWESPVIRPSRANVMSISSIISEPLRPLTPPPQVWTQEDELASEILHNLGLDVNGALHLPDTAGVDQAPLGRYDPYAPELRGSLDLDLLFQAEEEAYVQQRQESSELYVSMRYLETFDHIVDRWRGQELAKLRHVAQAEKDKVTRTFEAEQLFARSTFRDDLAGILHRGEAARLRHKRWEVESERNRLVYQRKQSRAMNKVTAEMWGNDEVRRKYGAFVAGARYAGLQDPRVRADVAKLRRATQGPQEEPQEWQSESDCSSISSLPSYASSSEEENSSSDTSRPLKRKRTPPNTRWWKAGRAQ